MNIWYKLLVLTSILHKTYNAKQEYDDIYGWRLDWHGVNTQTTQQTTTLTNRIGNNTMNNITVQIGGTVHLHCNVRDIDTNSEHQVSWIRRRDWHILSSGLFIYTNDERFQILHGDGTEDWTLQIKYVQKRDNGTYECQVATKQGLHSTFVDLNVVIPEAFILGTDELHLNVDSVINLICIIESPQPPNFVFWYHNDRMINYDKSRDIMVDTEPGPTRTQSRLTIHNAVSGDTGNYSCIPSNADPATIHVFVSEGSNKMAVIRRNANCVNVLTSNSLSQLIIICNIINLLYR